MTAGDATIADSAAASTGKDRGDWIEPRQGTARQSTGKPPTPEVILREAATLFREHGYARATTRELGVAVGIRGPSLYHHYRTKEDILFGICVESLGGLLKLVRPALEIDDPLGRLKFIVETHVSNLLGDRDMHATALREMRELSAPRLAEVTALRDEYEAFIRDACAAAQEQGAIRRDFTPRELTLSLLSLLNWSIFWYKPTGPLSPADVARLHAAIFLEGATPRDNRP